MATKEEEMFETTCASYPLSLFIAGDVEKATEECARYCNEIGFCVTVTPTTYVFRGDQEKGVIVGFINYPRYPLGRYQLRRHAEELAERLRVVLQ